MADDIRRDESASKITGEQFLNDIEREMGFAAREAEADEPERADERTRDDDEDADADFGFANRSQKTYPCPKCGQPVLFNDSHCLECGQSLGETRNHLVICLVCGNILLDSDRFCKKCGTEMTPVTVMPLSSELIDGADIANTPRGRYYARAVCPACGYELIDGDLFCRNCGKPVLDNLR